MSKFGLAFSGIFTCWSRRAIVDVSFLTFVCLNVVWCALFLHVSAVDHTNVFSLLKSGVTLEVLNECLFLNIISFRCLHRKLKKKQHLIARGWGDIFSLTNTCFSSCWRFASLSEDWPQRKTRFVAQLRFDSWVCQRLVC